MTSAIKKNESGAETAIVPTFKMGDRIRLKKRLERYVDTPISRKSVGTVSDVLTSAVDGSVAYVVAFAKEMEAPTFEAHQMVRVPQPRSKAEPKSTTVAPPALPNDLK